MLNLYMKLNESVREHIVILIVVSIIMSIYLQYWTYLIKKNGKGLAIQGNKINEEIIYDH